MDHAREMELARVSWARLEPHALGLVSARLGPARLPLLDAMAGVGAAVPAAARLEDDRAAGAALGVLFFVILPALKGAACDRPEGDPGKRKNDDPWRGEKRKNDDAPATFRTRDGEELEII